MEETLSDYSRQFFTVKTDFDYFAVFAKEILEVFTIKALIFYVDCFFDFALNIYFVDYFLDFTTSPILQILFFNYSSVS